MALTVPQAGVIAGRAAQPVTDPGAGQVAAGLSDLGARMAATFGRIDAERLDREMSRLQIGMTRDLGELRLKVEDMGDPDAAGAAWDEGVKALKDQYLTGTDETGRARVDPKNRANFGIAFDDLTTTHALALGGRFLEQRRSQRTASYMEYATVAGQQAATTDQATRAKLYADFDAETDKQVAAGILTPEDAVKAKQDFRTTTENTVAIGMMSADPARLVQMIDAGDLPGLPPETAATWRARAQEQVDQNTRDGLRDQKAAAEDKARDQIAIYKAGRMPSDPGWADTPDAAQSALHGELMAARDLSKERGNLAGKTVAELDAMIAEEEARTIDKPYQAERLKVLRDQRDQSSTGWATDAMAYAGKSGRKVPDLGQLDPAAPEGWLSGLAARVTFGQGLREDGLLPDGAPAPILTQGEQAAVKAALAGVADPAQRAELAAQIMGVVTSRKGDPAQIAALTDDKLLGWAAGGIAAGAMTPALAGEMLRGQEALDAKTIILPPEKDRVDPVFDAVGGLFAKIPGGPARQASVIAATDALYAARRGSVGPAGELDEDLYKQVLHEVMGGTGAYDSRDARGGVQEVAGHLTMLDPGIRAQDAENVLDSIAFDFGPGELDGRLRRQPDRATRAIRSAGNGEPLINGEPLGADEWERAYFVANGPGRYLLMLDVGPDGKQVLTADGKPWTFSLKRLLAGYGK